MSIILPLTSVSNSCLSWHISFITLLLLFNVNQSSSYPLNDCQKRDFLSCDVSLGSLRPHHLPQPSIFTNFSSNTTVNLPMGITRTVAAGRLEGAHKLSTFTVMENAANRTALDRVLKLIRSYDDKYKVLDVVPDNVDGMPTYEIHIDEDVPKESFPRAKLRRKIQSILDPYLNDVLTPYVNQRYSSTCGREGHRCTPCNSLIRRFRHGERQTHETHYDTYNFVTVVVSLSDYGIDYRGGLYLSIDGGEREFLGLNKGDAVIHQSSLMHGVKVYDLEEEPEKTDRWSWILWYLDSDTCEDHWEEWFDECAAEGDALCQQKHAEILSDIRGSKEKKVLDQIITLNRDAAKGGSTISAVQMAEFYRKEIPSSLPLDYNKAKEYYEMAIQSNSPGAHYGMADLILTLLSDEENSLKTIDNNWQKYKQEQLEKVLYHLEASAQMDYPFALFNLGIAHNYGYGVPYINSTLAAEWFAASGLPEGYFISSQQAKAVNETEREQAHILRAEKLGYFEPWNKKHRAMEMNLPWPVAMDGTKPPEF